MKFGSATFLLGLVEDGLLFFGYPKNSKDLGFERFSDIPGFKKNPRSKILKIEKVRWGGAKKRFFLHASACLRIPSLSGKFSVEMFRVLPFRIRSQTVFFMVLRCFLSPFLKVFGHFGSPKSQNFRLRH